MTYSSNLAASQQEGTPSFYEFLSAGEYFRATSWSEELTFLAETYAPISIKRGSIAYDNEFGSVRTTINALLNDKFLVYIAEAPIEPVYVTIYCAISSDLTDYRTLFKGEVMSYSTTNNEVTMDCEAGSRRLRQRFPRVVSQAFCNNDLFDSTCGLNESSWRVTATIDAISGKSIQSSTFASYANDYFKGGRIQFGNDHRLITAHTTNTITLHHAFRSTLEAGDTVYAYPGCDGDPDTCKTKFNNYSPSPTTGFLGMPLIPSHNPTVWGVDE